MKLRAFSQDLHVFKSVSNLAVRNLSYFWLLLFFFLNTDLRSQACSEWKWGTIKITNGQLLKARNLLLACLYRRGCWQLVLVTQYSFITFFFFCISKATLEALPHSLPKAGDKISLKLKDLIMCKTLWKVWLSEFQRMNPTSLISNTTYTSRERNHQCVSILPTNPKDVSQAAPKSW